MNSIKAKIQSFGRCRKLHTIISKETIKPSSPTPPHLKIHNLSFLDNISPNVHMPLILFYKNHNNGDINILKKSLSQSLTQYYPLAGMLLEPTAPHVVCNDEGVEFLEASIHRPLDDFIYKKDQDETLDLLIPNALGCATNRTSPNMVAVQLSYFTCGGVAVAISISHKVGDAFAMVNFINHWANLTRGGSPINPCFFSSSLLDNFKFSEFPLRETPEVKYAIRRFVFPNSKLVELKNKINAMGTSPLNPTRVESLTSLLFKCASTTKSGSLQPLSLIQTVNLRGKTYANFPQLDLGNLVGIVVAKIKDSSKTKLNEVIMSLRKDRMELQRARAAEEVGKKNLNAFKNFLDNQIQTYVFTSVCRFPIYQVDFGWGKPTQIMLRMRNFDANLSVLMDTPSGDGIEVTIQLEEKEMINCEKDKELQAYAYFEDM